MTKHTKDKSSLHFTTIGMSMHSSRPIFLDVVRSRHRQFTITVDPHLIIRPSVIRNTRLSGLDRCTFHLMPMQYICSFQYIVHSTANYNYFCIKDS